MKTTPHVVTCTDIDGNTFEVMNDQLVFRPAVYGVIIQDGKVLLSKQWGGYDFPGGGIELGERIEEALVREVKEETGIEIRPNSILHVSDSFFKLPYKGTYVQSIHLYYECQVVGGELSTEFFDEQEKQYADKPEWIPLSEVPHLKIYSSAEVSEILKEYL